MAVWMATFADDYRTKPWPAASQTPEMEGKERSGGGGGRASDDTDPGALHRGDNPAIDLTIYHVRSTYLLEVITCLLLITQDAGCWLKIVPRIPLGPSETSTQKSRPVGVLLGFTSAVPLCLRRTPFCIWGHLNIAHTLTKTHHTSQLVRGIYTSRWLPTR